MRASVQAWPVRARRRGVRRAKACATHGLTAPSCTLVPSRRTPWSTPSGQESVLSLEAPLAAVTGSLLRGARRPSVTRYVTGLGKEAKR